MTDFDLPKSFIYGGDKMPVSALRWYTILSLNVISVCKEKFYN